MRKAGGIVSLTGIAVAIALATPFDSRVALAQGRQGSTSRGPRHAAAKPYTTWQSYAGGAHSSQYSALDQINTKNVAKLDVAWSFPITGNSIFNPVVIDGVMYAPVGGGALAAIDAATGKEIWRKEGVAPSGARGMNYWESADRSDRGSSTCSAATSSP
jgi:glucose dehydrogenase